MTFLSAAFTGSLYIFGTVLLLCLSAILPLCSADFVVAKFKKLRRQCRR